MAPSVVLAAPELTMAQVRDYPFISELDTNGHGGHIAFVRDVHGARNVLIGTGRLMRRSDHRNIKAMATGIHELTFRPTERHCSMSVVAIMTPTGPHTGNLAPDPLFLRRSTRK